MKRDAGPRTSLEDLVRDLETANRPGAAAGATGSPDAGPPDAGPPRTAAEEPARVPLGEARERLGVPPHTFRQLMAQFYDLVEPDAGHDGPPASLSEPALTRLGEALRLRRDGWGYQEIRDYLKTWSPERVGSEPAKSGQTGSVPARNPGAAAPPGSGGYPTSGGSPAAVAGPPADAAAELAQLRQELVRIRAELARQAELRLEERDRQLTAILRLQQEIQHLRYELVTLVSRRDRKRRGVTPILGRRGEP